MMRAAHSIKGAARIVRVDLAVDLAHVMEDCFVAAQRGELQFRPADVDVLLKSVDLLGLIAQETKHSEANLQSIASDVSECVRMLKAVRTGQTPADAIATPTVIAAGSEVVQISPTERSDSPRTVGESAPAAQETAIPADVTAEKVNSTLVLQFGEGLFRDEAERQRQLLIRGLNEPISVVCIDLASTVDIDAVGLAFLCAARDYVRTQSRATLTFGPLSPQMEVVLRVAGVTPS
jgi:chemotaxis protein histidine kinase CheA